MSCELNLVHELQQSFSFLQIWYITECPLVASFFGRAILRITNSKRNELLLQNLS